MEILATPSDVRFGLFGGKGPSPAPTLFVFANKISETLGDYFNKCGRILSKQGFISVALDLPCHGEDMKPGEPAELDGWRARLEKGDNFIPGFLANASAVLDYLIQEGYTDPRKVAVCGTSRGGFIALHFAAAEPRARCVAAFGPVADLLVLREFAGMQAHSTTQALALVNIAEKLAGRPVWVCIGNNDERVGTDNTIRFTRRLVEAALRQSRLESCASSLSSARKLPAPTVFADRPGMPASLKAGCPACPSAKTMVELHVMPAVGHTIHPTAHDEAAEWILERMSEPVPSGEYPH